MHLQTFVPGLLGCRLCTNIEVFQKLTRATRGQRDHYADETARWDDEIAAGTGILVNVSDLAANATFYKRRVGRGEIRILIIHPGDRSDVLSCTLPEHDIRHVPEYTAISYCWTYNAELVDIRVDDNDTFKVPYHLLFCLRRLRSATSARRVWIDAFCINQDDQAEKSEQVSQMPRIYSSSWRTVIWLGETELYAPTCIVRANGYCAIEGSSSVEHGGMLRFLGEFLQDEEKSSLKPGAKHLMRVWWKRLWCVQEFMLSPRVPKVMAGPHLVRWVDFLAITEDHISPLFRESSRASSGHGSAIDQRSSEDDSEHRQGPSHKKSLLELLRITSKDFTCSDPKDRIFALIGITNDTEVAIQVDYARTVEEVYSEATVYLTNIEGNVDMLLDERVSRERDSLPPRGSDPLPTWIPQFASIKTTKEASTPDAFRASSEKPVVEIIDREPSIPCRCTGSCLKLRAVKLDNIVRRAAITVDRVHLEGSQDYHRWIPTNSRKMGGSRFQVFSTGSNSNRLDPFCDSSFEGYRYRSDLPKDEKYLVLDCILAALAIGFTQPRRLERERLPQIGLLLSDYLYNGTQSLEKVMEYHHHPIVKRESSLRLGVDLSLMRAELAQRYYLPKSHALSQDLEVAMHLQSKFLHRIGQLVDLTGCDLAIPVPESTYPRDSGYERVFFKTDDQHLGVGPGDLRIGDEVVVPFGSSRPWVLRSHGDHHVLVGDAFVPGIMTGQLEELRRRGDLEYTDYVLR